MCNFDFYNEEPLFSEGFFWRELMTDTGAEPEAWKYLAVVVPVVVLFGPIGAFLSSYCHRQVLAAFVYILDTAALVRNIFTNVFLSSLAPHN